MASYRTHLATSTTLGAGYAAIGYAAGLPLPTCALAAGLCGLAGILPDLDSKSGIPVREAVSFTAAIVPLLMLNRFILMGWSTETIVLVGGLIYLAIRFGMVEIFRRYTVHRGMWHSVPAAMTAATVTFLICACPDMTLRWYKAGAVLTGYMAHLVLDEIYSIQWNSGRLRFKKSFGTACKFWSRQSQWANVSTYGKLILFILLALGDPLVVRQLPEDQTELPRTARQLLEDAVEQSDGIIR